MNYGGYQQWQDNTVEWVGGNTVQWVQPFITWTGTDYTIPQSSGQQGPWTPGWEPQDYQGEWVEEYKKWKKQDWYLPLEHINITLDLGVLELPVPGEQMEFDFVRQRQL